MTLHNDDPRLTAYVFEELPAEEKARVEAELAEDEETRQEVVEIKRVLSEIRVEIGKNQTQIALDPEQRTRIERMAGRRAPSRTSSSPHKKSRRGAIAIVSVAATMAAAGLALLVVGPSGTTYHPVTGGEQSLIAAPNSDQRAFSRQVPASAPATAAARGLALKSGEKLRVQEQGPAGITQTGPLGQLADNKSDDGADREAYDAFSDNPFVRVATDPRSTFSIDVDTAAYALMRRHLNEGRLPPKGAVRIEELVNYFKYTYPEPSGNRPFAVHSEVAAAPWAPEHRLLKIGLKGKEIAPRAMPGANLVFLIDVSGSMTDENKLPLLKRAFSLLVEKLNERDRVSIVVYAGASGMVLTPTPGSNRGRILASLDQLQSGGSTNGGAGIELAYRIAEEQRIQGGINRVILATDGDFNVGTTSQSELIELIQRKAKKGVFLSVLGFGGGNYNDSMLEKLADKGNGNYAYIDTLSEANKVLVEQATGTLMTIAKDVKIQIEFNPAAVNAFRLIGYENRVLAHQDFNDDTKDAGEIGAGHTVTALYEIVPIGQAFPGPGTDPLKYQEPLKPTEAANSGELATIKLRYKKPEGDTSELTELVVSDSTQSFSDASRDFRFAASVAELGMLLRESPHKGNASYEQVLTLASGATNDDPYRHEFLSLVKKAEALSR